MPTQYNNNESKGLYLRILKGNSTDIYFFKVNLKLFTIKLICLDLKGN